MPAAFIILVISSICLLIRHIGTMCELRSLYRQLEEIGQGSHIELCLQSRQKPMLALCQKLNQIFALQARQQLHYEKAQKQLKQDITGLAHDIRTPLTGAAGYIQLAQECGEPSILAQECGEPSIVAQECGEPSTLAQECGEPSIVAQECGEPSIVAQECGEPSTQQRYLQTALDRLNVLGDMLEELFLYTKLASEEFEPNICEIQALPLLSACLIGMYGQFEEKGMVPRAEFASEGFRVFADEECLRRIFHNLIQNALLHGTGELVVRQENNSLIFENTVSETSMPDPEQMFERFYKADVARQKGSSGLGLFIVRELVQKMGGSVRAGLVGRTLRIVLEFQSRPVLGKK